MKAATFEKLHQYNLILFPVAWLQLPFHVCAYFCMDAYKRDIVVVIKIRAYIDGSLFVWMPDFTVAFSITTQAGVDPRIF